jgi:pimeloyl-[acyl-carrier protein] methyl ester esterase
VAKLYFEVYGQGPCLVLLHGWGMHTGVWRDFAKRLAVNYQVVCVDLPGHGRSSGLPEYNLSAIADAIVSDIQTEKFSLLGWSLGATLAMSVAEHYPQRLSKLVVLAGNAKFVAAADWPGVKPEVLQKFAEQLLLDKQATQLRFLALQIQGNPNSKQLLQKLKHAINECPEPETAALLAGLAILRDADFRCLLQKLPCESHFIAAEKDALIPLQSALAAKNLNPAIKLHVLSRAGHAPFLSHPQSLLDILSTIL